MRNSDSKVSTFRMGVLAFCLGLPSLAPALTLSGPDSVRDGVSASFRFNLGSPPREGERLTLKVIVFTDNGLQTIHDTEMAVDSQSASVPLLVPKIGLPISSVKYWGRVGEDYFNFYPAVVILSRKDGEEAGHLRIVMMQNIGMTRGCACKPVITLSRPFTEKDGELPVLETGGIVVGRYNPILTDYGVPIQWNWKLYILTSRGAILYDSATSGGDGRVVDSSDISRWAIGPRTIPVQPAPLMEGGKILGSLVISVRTQEGTWSASHLLTLAPNPVVILARKKSRSHVPGMRRGSHSGGINMDLLGRPNRLAAFRSVLFQD